MADLTLYSTKPLPVNWRDTKEKNNKTIKKKIQLKLQKSFVQFFSPFRWISAQKIHLTNKIVLD